MAEPVNSIEVTNKLKCFRPSPRGSVYIVNEVQDPKTETVTSQDYKLDCKEGLAVVRAVVLEVAKRAVSEKEFNSLLEGVKVMSLRHPVREPVNPIGEEDSSPKSQHLEDVLKVLDFFLDNRGEIRARFINDHRDFPLKGDVVRAELDGFLRTQGQKVGKDELDSLVYQCVRHATKRYRSNPEKDELLDDESVVYAVVKFMADEVAKKLKAQAPSAAKHQFEATPTNLRAELVKVVKEEFPEADKDWPQGAHFTKAVMTRQDAGVFQAYGIRAKKRRTGVSRFISLEVTDLTKLSKFTEGSGGESKAEKGAQQEQPTQDDTEGEAEQEEPTQDKDWAIGSEAFSSDASDAQNGSAASLEGGDAGDAQDGPVASPEGDDADDAQEEETASHQPVTDDPEPDTQTEGTRTFAPADFGEDTEMSRLFEEFLRRRNGKTSAAVSEDKK